MHAGFSERTFEFCFNAEFCNLNAALLATHPHIPTQNAEKDLGYDVEFEINKGGYVKSLFLQHKVASHAASRAGRNAQFFNHHGGEYYRFPVDNDQHDTLCNLSATKGDAFYCAPCFRGSQDLGIHWRNQTIGSQSILLDPLQVGRAPPGRHNITYGPNGEKPALHSDSRDFEKAYRADKDGMPQLKIREIDSHFIEELGADLISRAHKREGAEAVTREVRGRSPIEVVQTLLGRVYQVSWLLLREAFPLAQAERQRQATRPGHRVRCTLSCGRAWRPAVVARLARTLGPRGDHHRAHSSRHRDPGRVRARLG